MDPFEFAMAIAMAVASITGGDPDPQPEIPSPTVVESSTFTIPSGDDAGTTVIVNPFDLEWDEQHELDGEQWSIGWIVSPVSGRLVCVTASPCEQDPQFRGPEDSTYNWVTGEEN